MVKIRKENENKKERFIRLAESRTESILNGLRILGNCSNSKYYDYHKEDVDIIFSEIEKKTKEIKKLFYSELYKIKPNIEKFSLKR